MKSKTVGVLYYMIFFTALMAFNIYVLLDTFVIPHSIEHVQTEGDSTTDRRENLQTVQDGVTSGDEDAVDGVYTDNSYQDKNISVYITTERAFDADIYIAMCTTSPFTQKETIENALNKVLYEGYDSAFTAKKMQTFAWYNGKPINYDLDSVPRTQDIEPVYVETSAFFIFKKQLWTRYGRRIGFRPYIQEVGEIESVDIDTLEDLKFAQTIADNVLHI